MVAFDLFAGNYLVSFALLRASESGDGLDLVGDIFYTDAGSHKWLIAIHGYTGKREHMYSYARYYAEKGYNILTPDMRSHGDSEGSWKTRRRD